MPLESLKKRLVAFAVAASVLIGGSVAAAAPASAATMGWRYYTHTESGFTSKSACTRAEVSASRRLAASGARIYAGDSCYYFNSYKKWAFYIYYKRLVPIAS